MNWPLILWLTLRTIGYCVIVAGALLLAFLLGTAWEGGRWSSRRAFLRRNRAEVFVLAGLVAVIVWAGVVATWGVR